MLKLDDSPLVSVDWLYTNIKSSNLLVLDASIPKATDDSIAENATECIPGALFFDLKQKFSDTSADFPNTVPSAKQFEKEARTLGIDNDSVVIVYDNKGIYSSARVWWLFKAFGLESVAALDGGLPEWKSKGFATHQKHVTPTSTGNFKAKPNTSLFTDFKGITRFSKLPHILIFDARSKKRFHGEIPEPRQGLRSGTIPNSVNLPYTELFNGYTMKSTEELETIFNTFVDQHDQLVFSCGSGITACNLALAAVLVGYDNLCVYDGSWTEYGTLTE